MHNKFVFGVVILSLLVAIRIDTGSAELMLNEILAANLTGIQDEDGDNEDWIEIFNSGPAAVNLSGYGLSDDFDEPHKWIFPSVEMPAGKFLLIFASGKDRYSGELHSNFKISSDGEPLTLHDDTGAVVDLIGGAELLADISRGRELEGGSWLLFDLPTPGDSNTSQGYTGIAEAPTMVTPPGFYTVPASVQITGGGETEVHFTLDGALPDQTDRLYSNPISVDTTTAVRARAFRTGYLPSKPITGTYVINEPLNLDIVSLVTDPFNLWDWETGIYVLGPDAEPDYPYHGANFWEDWERPAHLEFFEKDGSDGFQADCGVRIHGGYSRALPQRSMRFHFKDEYGLDEVDYRPFYDLWLGTFKRLVIRNCGQDFNYAHCRDILANEIAVDADLDRIAYNSCTVFLNGVYWGYMNLRERQDRYYLRDHFDVDPDGVDLIDSRSYAIEGNTALWDSFYDFIDQNDMSDPTNYAWVQTQMETDNFAEYLVFNIFLGHSDWPDHNIKRWRVQGAEGRWRWLFQDMDHCLGVVDADHNTLDFALNPDGEVWGNPHWSTVIQRKLLTNDQFRNYFLNCYADRLNSSFLPDRMHDKFDQVTEGIAAEIPRHRAFWEISSTWEGRLAHIVNFIDGRAAPARSHLMDYFDIPGTITLSLAISPPGSGRIDLTVISIDSTWSGAHFAGVPIRLQAIPGQGYIFSGWSDPELTDSEVAVTALGDTLLTAIFQEDPTAWSAAVINEINYNSHSSFDPGDWVEIHNPGTVDLELGGWRFLDSDDDHIFLFPGETILAAGDYLVLSDNLPAFSALFPDVDCVVGELSFSFSGAGELLRLSNQTDDLMDFVNYSDSAPWPTEPDGNGPTLELINPELDNNLPENWSSSLGSAPHGTPGESNSALDMTAASEAVVSPAPAFDPPWPNPFNPVTTLEFSLPVGGWVQLAIFDLAGRRVALLVNEKRGAGRHQIQWRAEGVASGLYLARFEIDERIFSRKLLLLK